MCGIFEICKNCGRRPLVRFYYGKERTEPHLEFYGCFNRRNYDNFVDDFKDCSSFIPHVFALSEKDGDSSFVNLAVDRPQFFKDKIGFDGAFRKKVDLSEDEFYCLLDMENYEKCDYHVEMMMTNWNDKNVFCMKVGKK